MQLIKKGKTLTSSVWKTTQHPKESVNPEIRWLRQLGGLSSVWSWSRSRWSWVQHWFHIKLMIKGKETNFSVLFYIIPAACKLQKVTQTSKNKIKALQNRMYLFLIIFRSYFQRRIYLFVIFLRPSHQAKHSMSCLHTHTPAEMSHR